MRALCLVYPWGRSLDGKDDQRDNETPEENPGAVVVSLLEKGEAPWAMVTNGKLWRLYSQRTHSRATNYSEIDLEEALAHGIQDILAWRWKAVDPEKHIAFGRLHELVRLALLRFLSLPDEIIQDHSNLTGPRLQGFLDGLRTVDGEFSKRQKAWCE